MPKLKNKVTRNNVQSDLNSPLQEQLKATRTFTTQFFRPTFSCLFELLDHTLPGVRINATVVLLTMLTENLPVFEMEYLAEIACEIKTHYETETDERVRLCLSRSLEDLMESVLAYTDVCRDVDYR